MATHLCYDISVSRTVRVSVYFFRSQWLTLNSASFLRDRRTVSSSTRAGSWHRQPPCVKRNKTTLEPPDHRPPASVHHEGSSGPDVSGHSHKEETGFTHAWNVEPVTFRPHENFAGKLPGNITWRPTGSSIMKKDFRNTLYMKGCEPLPSVTGRSDRSNGYVKGSKAMADVQPKASEMVGYTRASQLHPMVLQRVKKEDPAEFSNVTHPHQYTSLTQRSFQGVGWNEGGRLAREEVGGKELTGFSENNDPMVEPRDRDTQRFSTHYQGRFSNPNPVCSPGMVPSSRPGVQPPLKNGFSKSTQVHRFAPPLDTGRMLRGIDPYVARSILKRHPYFDDHTHNNKEHTL